MNIARRPSRATMTNTLVRLTSLLLLFSSTAYGFTVFRPAAAAGVDTRVYLERDEFLRAGLLGVVSCFSTAVSPVQATTTLESIPSLSVADEVKMLDMSLPSYGDIKDPKASAGNVKSLTVTPPKGGSLGISAGLKKKGVPMSSVLPSMGKKGPKKKSSGLGY
jgi:hypothetical protein